MTDQYAFDKDGQKIFIGNYTLEMRNHYMEYRVAKYLIDHKKDDAAQARKYARVAWRKKALRSLQPQPWQRTATKH